MKKIALVLGIWMILISPFSYSKSQIVVSDKVLNDVQLKQKVGGDWTCPVGAIGAVVGVLVASGPLGWLAAIIGVVLAGGNCANGAGNGGSNTGPRSCCSNGGSPEPDWACAQNGGQNKGGDPCSNQQNDVCCEY